MEAELNIHSLEFGSISSGITSLFPQTMNLKSFIIYPVVGVPIDKSALILRYDNVCRLGSVITIRLYLL